MLSVPLLFMYYSWPGWDARPIDAAPSALTRLGCLTILCSLWPVTTVEVGRPDRSS